MSEASGVRSIEALGADGRACTIFLQRFCVPSRAISLIPRLKRSFEIIHLREALCCVVRMNGLELCGERK